MILYRNKQKFIDEAKNKIAHFDEQLISGAWDFARQAYTTLQQKSKKEEQEIDSSHPFGVAQHLLAIECDSSTMAAALLYDLVESKITSIKEIKKRFGPDVARLVEGVSKLAPLDMPPSRAWMYGNSRRETLRKFFIGIVNDDPRVAIIKLADRLYRLTTFGALTQERKRIIAQESLDVFAPLAEALELGAFQFRIQEFAFRYLEPDTYHHLEQKLRERWEECKKIRNIAMRSLEDELAKAGINASVYDRKKEIYSIHQKMLSYKLKFEEVYDLIGIRIIVDTQEDCYKAKQIVDQLGTEVKYDDWIHTPRGQGGYQSLHKVVRERGVLLEIQIRSKEMHLRAERGSAAHWIYKLGGTSLPPEFVKKINTLRETLEKTVGGTDKDSRTFSESSVQHGLKANEHISSIHVFTPAGDVILLPQGSTPLDFAYRIHTIVGHECRGAWVQRSTWTNRKYVPLDYELDDGDTVIIDRRKGATPRLNWLTDGKARSHQAQQRIRHYFLEQKRDEMIADARNLVQEQLRLLSDFQVNMRDLLNSFVQTKLLKAQSGEEGLYLAIADGRISLERLQRIIGEIGVKRRLTDEGLSKEFVRDLVKWFGDCGVLSSNREDALFLAVAKREIPVKLLRQAINELASSFSLRSGVTVQTAAEDSSRDHGLSFHAAQCCYPLPDDPIVGFVTLGHGLSVHREVCPQMDTLSKSKPKVQITWKDLAIPKNCTFICKLFVTVAEYNPKIRRKIQDVLLKADVIIREESVVGASQIRFIISVKDVKHIHEIQNRLKQVEGVSEIGRQEEPKHVAGAITTKGNEDRSDNSGISLHHSHA